MNPALRLERTADGRRELRDRTLGLDARHRALLQQADGRRSLAEIKQRLSSVMDVEQVVDELLRMRLLRSAAMMSAHGAVPAVRSAAPAG